MDVLEPLSEEARLNVKMWLDGPYDYDTKKSIEAMLASDIDGVENAFYTHLSFGTGGMRGLMGVGSNRMNIYTIRQATQGLANYIKKTLRSPKPHRVVIGFDSRHNSQLFATEAARVLAESSIEVFLFSHLRPTPLVSFACRHLQCSAGIMITASHNPPEYNGYKVYWNDGGQVLPPHDTGIMNEIRSIPEGTVIPVSREQDPFIHLVDTQEDEAYFQAISQLALWPATDKKELSVLFSPLHGTGGTLIKKALHQVGISSFHVVDQQMIPDGAFPTAKKPNPEEREALELGIQKMMKENCDIFLATDPDGDRLGCVVNHHGVPHILTGNQIVALATEWILHQKTELHILPSRPAVVKSIVTTPLVAKIAQKWGATCFDVLPGFKYIAQLMNAWENDPNGYVFIFGCEESYGSLYGTHARDKDAIVAACMLSEIAWHFKKENATLVDGLEALWMKYGYYEESLFTYSFGETKAGRDKMVAVMKSLRFSRPKQFANIPCIAFEDLQNQFYEGEEALRLGANLPRADVLIFTLQGGSTVIIRPSGTEPKVKIYCMVTSQTQDQDLSAAKKEASTTTNLIKKSISELFQ